MLTKNEAQIVEVMSLLIGGILMSVYPLADMVGRDLGRDLGGFVNIEAVVMYLNYLFYVAEPVAFVRSGEILEKPAA